jgi:uncharacterized protein YjiS (DUF1127 family)
MMTERTITLRFAGGERFKRACVRFSDTLWLWQERARQRRHLRSLNDHMLKDLGLSRADVEHETAKPFWQD